MNMTRNWRSIINLKSSSLLVLIVLLGMFLSPMADAYRKPKGEYFDILPLFWGNVYPEGGETIYCGRNFGSRKGRSINVEHVFPMAWTLRKFNCRDRNHCRRTSKEFNRIEADMHNLYPSRKDINHARGSHGFGMVKGEHRFYGKCDIEIDPRRRRVEPRPEVRGNIARAMFYMQDTYNLKIFKKQAQMLQRWNRKDPPDKEELRRNQVIDKIQGRRNRFIDDPNLVEKLRF